MKKRPPKIVIPNSDDIVHPDGTLNYQKTKRLHGPHSAIPQGEGEATDRVTYYFKIKLGERVVERGEDLKSLFHNKRMTFDCYVETINGDKYLRLLGKTGYQRGKFYAAALDRVIPLDK